MKVDVHGSCVARGIFNADMGSDIEVNQCFSRNSIVCCMMPAVETDINTDQLVYKSEYAKRCVKYSLDKSTVSRLLSSESDFLVVDFFDLCQHVAVAGETTFSTYDYTMLGLDEIKKIVKG